MRWEPSPPILTTASMPRSSHLRIISSDLSTASQVPSKRLTGQAKGPPLLVVPMIVPPWTWIPETLFGSSVMILVGSVRSPLKD